MDPTLNNINQLVYRIEELSEELAIANEIIDSLFEEYDSGELVLAEDVDFLAEEEKKKWIQKALKKKKEGQLHKDLKVKKGEKIPEKKLEKAAHAKGKKGQRARLAMKLREYSKKKKDLKEATDLAAEAQYLTGMLKDPKTDANKAQAIKARLAQIQKQMTPPTQGGAMGGQYYTNTIEGEY